MNSPESDFAGGDRAGGSVGLDTEERHIPTIKTGGFLRRDAAEPEVGHPAISVDQAGHVEEDARADLLGLGLGLGPGGGQGRNQCHGDGHRDKLPHPPLPISGVPTWQRILAATNGECNAEFRTYVRSVSQPGEGLWPDPCSGAVDQKQHPSERYCVGDVGGDDSLDSAGGER